MLMNFKVSIDLLRKVEQFEKKLTDRMSAVMFVKYKAHLYDFVLAKNGNTLNT